MGEDRPITKASQDRLARKPLCERIARKCLAQDEGGTIGLIGRWGSGKTSCLNLVREVLEKKDGVTVVNFNPWLWSGTGDLVVRLLNTLASQLARGGDLEPAGAKLARYAKSLAQIDPLTASLMRAAEGIAPDLVGVPKNTPDMLRGRVEDALRSDARKYVVMVDDADRLEPPQLQELLMAVRLAGQLPGVVYLMALDKGTASRTLARAGYDGNEYLEKIIEDEVHIPLMHREQTNAMLDEQMAPLIRGDTLHLKPENEHAWGDLYMNVLMPLLVTPRDVMRFATALETTLATTPPNRVRLDDLVAASALRMKTPETWEYLTGNVEHATVHPWLAVTLDTAQERRTADTEAARVARGLLDATPEEHRPVVQRFMEERLDRLRMAQSDRNIRPGEGWEKLSKRLRQAGRIAEREVLETYLASETTTPATVEREAREAFELLDSAEHLRPFLESIPSQRLEDVVQALEGHSSGFRAEQARVAVPVLMTLRATTPRRERPLLRPDTEMVFFRVVLQLLVAMDEKARARHAEEMVLATETLGSQAKLLGLYRHAHEHGGPAMPRDLIEQLEARWFDRLLQADKKELDKEGELFTVAHLAHNVSKRTGRPWQVWGEPTRVRRILVNATVEAVSATGDKVNRYQQLKWNGLQDLWGSEQAVMEAVKEARDATPPPTSKEAASLELAWDYWSGRSDADIEPEQAETVQIHIGDQEYERIETLTRKTGKSKEDLCTEALRKGHMDETISAVRGLVPGAPRFPHPHEAVGKTRRAQRRAAKEIANRYGCDVESVWRTTLAAGLDRMEKELERG